MPQLLLQEGRQFGVPVWRFAVSRGEAVYVHAPRNLGDRPDQPALTHAEATAAERTFWKPWGTVELRTFDEEYALYLPCSQSDFRQLCILTDNWGGCIEVIAPCELRLEDADAWTRIWSTSRPLRYLRQTDLCRELETPWAYVLGIYNYDPCLSVFVAESQGMVDELAERCRGVQDCYIVSPQEASASEEINWRKIYRQFEEQPPLTLVEQQEMKERRAKLAEEWENGERQ
ncbi:MAG TPA: hypothetical protein VMV10_11460 [Pirellulales bacterium]|nr:hypothetical protein [Pirellulales bacterium]